MPELHASPIIVYVAMLAMVLSVTRSCRRGGGAALAI